MHKLYYQSGCCLDFNHSLTLSGDDELPIIDFNKLVKKALNNIYHKRGGTGDIDPALFELNNSPLQKGIDKTFASAGVEFGKRNKVFIDQFKHNTSIFSAFKTHKQGDELAKLMLDEGGKQRTFNEFKKAAILPLHILTQK